MNHIHSRVLILAQCSIWPVIDRFSILLYILASLTSSPKTLTAVVTLAPPIVFCCNISQFIAISNIFE